MPVIKLKAGQSVMVAAVDPSLEIGGGPMPGGGAPVDPNYGIDIGLGVPSHPIVLPPDPTQPLPQPPHPDQTLPGSQPHPDQTLPGAQPHPEHPIVLPPPEEIPPPIEPPAKPCPGWELKTVWSPTTGWIVVAVPTGPHATPSKRK